MKIRLIGGPCDGQIVECKHETKYVAIPIYAGRSVFGHVRYRWQGKRYCNSAATEYVFDDPYPPLEDS